MCWKTHKMISSLSSKIYGWAISGLSKHPKIKWILISSWFLWCPIVWKKLKNRTLSNECHNAQVKLDYCCFESKWLSSPRNIQYYLSFDFPFVGGNGFFSSFLFAPTLIYLCFVRRILWAAAIVLSKIGFNEDTGWGLSLEHETEQKRKTVYSQSD